MTKDQAISVGVRLDTALLELEEALKHIDADDDEIGANIAEGIEEAQQAAATARSLARNVSGA
jgi:hypothetical protein